MNKIYVICKDDGTGVPAGIYLSLPDAMFNCSSYNPDIAEFFIGSNSPNWVVSAHDLRKEIGNKK